MILGETKMENIRISTTILMVLASIEIGVTEIVTKPTDTEVVVNGSTFLNCSTNSRQEIHWFHTAFGSNQGREIVYGYDKFYKQYIGRFQMEKNEANGAYNLVIPSVKIEDAGVFECQDETGGGSKAAAQLIVLDANPVCEPHLDMHEIIGPNNCGIEPTQLILSCTVRYHGYEAPIIAWSKASNNTPGPVSEGVTHETIDNNRVVYNLTIKGNSSVKDGDSYFCNSTRSTTLDAGCKSGEVKVKGTGADSPTCAASEICEPYIKPYKDAMICFFLIILPIAVGGAIFVFWCIKVYRPKKLKKEESLCDWLPCSRRSKSAENPATKNTETAEEMVRLHESSSSQGEFAGGSDARTNDVEKKSKKLLERIERRDKDIINLRENEALDKVRINSLQLENDKLKAEVKEIDQLQAKVKELEQRLYLKENVGYLDKPVLAHMIPLSEKITGKTINGITVLGKELFVIGLAKGNPEMEVYDSKTFQHQRNMEVRGMTDPLDIASSKEANCLYVVSRLNKETESRVVRIEPTGKELQQWPTGGRMGRLSTYESNVILCLSDKQLINEYSPEGELIVTVRLSPAARLNNPLHAIKVTSAYFVVSHGDFKDELHRVCVVDVNGEIIKECRKWEKSKETALTRMKVPFCLLEDNERSIIVADTEHKRILLLSSVLKYQRKLIEEVNGLKDFPARLCFDDTQSRLFVAVNKWSDSKKEWKDGRILIFNIK